MVEEPLHEDTAEEPLDDEDYDDDAYDTEAPAGADDPTTPNVIRKRHGRYDAPKETAPEEALEDREPEASTNDIEDVPGSFSINGGEERPRVRRRRPDPADEGEKEPLSGVPEDLFQWPEAWKEFRPRERSRRPEGEEPEGPVEDHPDGGQPDGR